MLDGIDCPQKGVVLGVFGVVFTNKRAFFGIVSSCRDQYPKNGYRQPKKKRKRIVVYNVYI
jgi:hypothetical protein